jgi:membrane-associated protease RseP (regulator of RpoE activity)
MFNRLYISVVIVTSAFTLVIAQTPEAPKAGTAQTFAFAFDGGSYLGVQTQEVNKENFAKFGLSSVRGVAIEKVIENSPAASAGLLANDVIVRFEGEEVSSTRKLTRLISEVAPDHQARLTIVRNGSEQEITATLAKRPIPKFDNGNFTVTTPMPMGKLEMPNMPSLPRVFSMPEGETQTFAWRTGEGRQIGVGVYPLTRQLSENYGVESGLMINTIRENSPAAKAGLKAGDIIVEVEGKAVKGDFDLIRAINGKKEGDIQLTILRDRKRQTISVTPEVSKDGGFFFHMDDEDGLTPRPGVMQLASPGLQATPMVAPAPMTPLTPLARPGRIL